jgi:hypothetical protein
MRLRECERASSDGLGAVLANARFTPVGEAAFGALTDYLEHRRLPVRRA